MEQKDYFLREIEKIGLLLRSIINRLTGSNENTAISVENTFQDAKELLIDEIGFNIDHFVALSANESMEYIHRFKGINSDNLELLANLIAQLGYNDNSTSKRVHLEKSLELLEFCRSNDRTYSPERENSISQLKKAINQIS